MVIDPKLLEKKKQKLILHRPPSELTQNLDEWLRIELAYTSNAIEGNTLTRQETALVVEKGITVAGKSLREHLEAVNHAQAYELVKDLSCKKRQEVTEQTVLDIHSLILQKIDDTNAGRYRTVSARIAGSTVTLPNTLKVPSLMKNFISWLHSTPDHPIKIAADAHFKLVSIHPFVDGNGRTARLFMNLLLMQEGYPPAIIRKEDRIQYLNSVEKGQLLGDLENYYHLIFKALDRSLTIYSNALEKKEIKIDQPRQKLLKIGELAKATGEHVSTIRYWTQEGLLEAANITPGGYQLYAQTAIGIVQKIRHLQEKKRLHIPEIRKALKQ